MIQNLTMAHQKWTQDGGANKSRNVARNIEV